MTEFLRDSVCYRAFVRDRMEEAVYDDYTMDGVLVREAFAVDPDRTENGLTTVYFFTGMSTCTGSDGKVCGMPYPKHGDLVVLRAGTESERVLRVAQAGYFTCDGAGEIPKITELYARIAELERKING